MAQLKVKYKRSNGNYGKDQKKNQNKKILTIFFGVCWTDLWLDTSVKGLKQFYTSPEPILGETYFINNFCNNKDFCGKQAVSIKQESSSIMTPIMYSNPCLCCSHRLRSLLKLDN